MRKVPKRAPLAMDVEKKRTNRMDTTEYGRFGIFRFSVENVSLSSGFQDTYATIAARRQRKMFRGVIETVPVRSISKKIFSCLW